MHRELLTNLLAKLYDAQKFSLDYTHEFSLCFLCPLCGDE